MLHCTVLTKYRLGKIVSYLKNSYLSTGTHDVHSKKFNLITSPIYIKDSSWIASDVFICPGVVIEENCVVGVRSLVTKSTEKNTINFGIPSKKVKMRI